MAIPDQLNKVVTAKVTRHCISHGRMSDPKNCPVALALRNMGFEWVSASYVRTWARVRGLEYEFFTPQGAQKFMVRYDNGDEVDPQDFRFRIVSINVYPQR